MDVLQAPSTSVGSAPSCRGEPKCDVNAPQQPLTSTDADAADAHAAEGVVADGMLLPEALAALFGSQHLQPPHPPLAAHSQLDPYDAPMMQHILLPDPSQAWACEPESRHAPAKPPIQRKPPISAQEARRARKIGQLCVLDDDSEETELLFAAAAAGTPRLPVIKPHGRTTPDGGSRSSSGGGGALESMFWARSPLSAAGAGAVSGVTTSSTTAAEIATSSRRRESVSELLSSMSVRSRPTTPQQSPSQPLGVMPQSNDAGVAQTDFARACIISALQRAREEEAAAGACDNHSVTSPPPTKNDLLSPQHAHRRLSPPSSAPGNTAAYRRVSMPFDTNAFQLPGCDTSSRTAALAQRQRSFSQSMANASASAAGLFTGNRTDSRARPPSAPSVSPLVALGGSTSWTNATYPRSSSAASAKRRSSIDMDTTPYALPLPLPRSSSRESLMLPQFPTDEGTPGGASADHYRRRLSTQSLNETAGLSAAAITGYHLNAANMHRDDMRSTSPRFIRRASGGSGVPNWSTCSEVGSEDTDMGSMLQLCEDNAAKRSRSHSRSALDRPMPVPLGRGHSCEDLFLPTNPSPQHIRRRASPRGSNGGNSSPPAYPSVAAIGNGVNGNNGSDGNSNSMLPALEELWDESVNLSGSGLLDVQQLMLPNGGTEEGGSPSSSSSLLSGVGVSQPATSRGSDVVAAEPDGLGLDLMATLSDLSRTVTLPELKDLQSMDFSGELDPLDIFPVNDQSDNGHLDIFDTQGSHSVL